MLKTCKILRNLLLVFEFRCDRTSSTSIELYDSSPLRYGKKPISEEGVYFEDIERAPMVLKIMKPFGSPPTSPIHKQSSVQINLDLRASFVLCLATQENSLKKYICEMLCPPFR